MRLINLVCCLEDQVRHEFITHQQQMEFNAKLQDEYDQLRKRLSKAETYILVNASNTISPGTVLNRHTLTYLQIFLVIDTHWQCSDH